jgi:peptidoglycan/xylan/chitin deacetylase (PgdA/CDA1 family)
MSVHKRAVHVVISVVFYALVCLRDLLLSIAGVSLRRPSVILYYHVVAPEHRARLAAQMDALLRWAKPVRADIAGPVDTSVRHVAVTFDDASETVAANAFPELQERGIPCTIFAISGLLGQLVRWDKYSDRIMSADELRSLDSDLVTIGSHTVSHPMLTSLSESAARLELRKSRAQLERLLQRKVTLFSFPFGAFNNKLVEFCREAGYERVFSTLPLSAFQRPAQFICGRVRVDPTDWPLEFHLKLVGAYRWRPWAIAMKHKLVENFRAQRQVQGGVSAVANADHPERV